ncbi:MAG: choice-of-anchor D domain-containing protein [Terriglobales bacterium]
MGQSQLGVFTQQYTNARTGNNTSEKILTPKNVNSTQFGKVYSFTVDGQVYAQPLWVSGVKIPGQGTHTVVYVATELDSLFAFDANTGVQLWQDNFTDPANGIGPVPCGTDGNNEISCGVYPYYGITGTPVIDPQSQTMYLIARTYNNNTGVGYQILHALDITTGAEKFGGPVEIEGSLPGTGAGSVNGVVSFNELADIQRPGLLLETNPKTGLETVYLGWAGAQHGWIMAYDAHTLQQTAIFLTTPDAIRGGVWQSGNGLAADSDGYIYASTGDGLFDVNSGGPDYGDSLLKLDGDLNVVDYFTPMDQACRYASDFDVSSSGPVILPTQAGQYPDEVLESGKGGDPCDSSGFAPIYLADRDNLGKYNSLGDNIIEEVPGAPIGYWSSPALWTSATQSAIYYAGQAGKAGVGDYMKMYTLSDGLLSTTPVSQSAAVFPIGATPSSSGNGSTNGIIWATLRQEALGLQPGQLPAILYAYDATNLANMLYNSAQNTLRDQGGCANKFQVPVVAGGKVFVGTQNEVDVFGLLGTPTAAAPAINLNHPCYTFNKQEVGTTSTPRFLVVTNIGNAALNLGTISIRGLNASDFAQTNNCPKSLAPNATCSIRITFTPSAVGPRVAQVMIPDNAAGNPHNTAVTGAGIT